ncbi:hypothetical protein KDL01_31105 [Actinospica durhamensis]|uniref:PIN domain-containing protein n=1 Tax=Actinospica durhamensis TaxID=1508375 RepID=A0A941IQK6_9ACTN|nr:hypothetical protein [Actinospica durhamensis]MBR7837765.1 hypothetical protein [Actinospica durhamensis]
MDRHRAVQAHPRRGARSAGVLDLVLCATAAARGLVVLHDDKDFDTVARVLPEVSTLRITDALPGRPAPA